MRKEKTSGETQIILNHVTAAKDEIIEAFENKRGRPTKTNGTRRGPKDTRMMKIQRTVLVTYVTVERHKAIAEVTLSDAFHVWNLPENKDAWNEAAARRDIRRGYKDYTSLYASVKNLAEKDSRKLLRFTAV